ncbi:MAG: hypothetical protein A2224_03730 [Candidatus Magasanikbacteria bacterium RIFOXYA2_FULL_40_20]|nr:MAG: hypothetical protein A2224_03730 [Candidatus Magasanikbacteria bacterium RIFOXYA2_FULL_40_20]
MDDFKKKLEQSQIAGWKSKKEEVVLFFQGFGLDVNDLYDQIIMRGYEKMQKVCYFLSKIRKVADICDFLDKKAVECRWDVDVMKIFFLISHAEIAMQNFGKTGKKADLVKEFFGPVVEKYDLNNNIKLSLSEIISNREINFGASEILYKIRCEYTHEGNYTGRIFKTTIEPNEEHVGNMISFKINNSEILCGECYLTYEQFLVIYMEALIKNIENFIKK